METLEHGALLARRTTSPEFAGTVFVDCIDAGRRDMLVYWLMLAGYRVHESRATHFPSNGGAAKGADVLLTDRFGPGLPGEATIFQLKEARPGLRVIVLGHGDARDAAQLSLALAAGADATLPAPLDRERVLDLIDRQR